MMFPRFRSQHENIIVFFLVFIYLFYSNTLFHIYKQRKNNKNCRKLEKKWQNYNLQKLLKITI